MRPNLVHWARGDGYAAHAGLTAPIRALIQCMVRCWRSCITTTFANYDYY